MDQVNDSKLTTTQNIIRNKFKQAYTNRVEHEYDVNRALKPLTTSPLSTTTTTKTADLETEKKDSSLRDLSKTTNDTPQLRLSNKSYSIHAIKSQSIETNKEKNRDPNELCNNLRMLLSSAGDLNSMQMINAILEELHDLEIIV